MKQINPVQKKISNDIANLVGEGIQQTTGFVMDNGSQLIERVSLLILQQTENRNGIMQMVHLASPGMLNIFHTLRKSSSIVPFMVGQIARKSTLTGLTIGFEALKIPGKVFNLVIRK